MSPAALSRGSHRIFAELSWALLTLVERGGATLLLRAPAAGVDLRIVNETGEDSPGTG